jgi:hypothetical protein
MSEPYRPPRPVTGIALLYFYSEKPQEALNLFVLVLMLVSTLLHAIVYVFYTIC